MYFKKKEIPDELAKRVLRKEQEIKGKLVGLCDRLYDENEVLKKEVEVKDIAEDVKLSKEKKIKDNKRLITYDLST